MNISLPFEILYLMYQMKKHGFEMYLVGGAVRDLILSSVCQIQDKSEQHFLNLVVDWDFTSNAKPQEIQAVFPDNFYENEYGCISVNYKDLLTDIKKSGFQLPDIKLEDMVRKYRQKKLVYEPIDLKKADKIHHSLEKNDELNQAIKEKKKDVIKIEPFEITTFRADEVYQNFRQPEEVKWGDDIKHDLERRDFTINALALDIKTSRLKQIVEQTNVKNLKLKSIFTISAQDYHIIDNHKGMLHLTQKKIQTVGNPSKRFNEDALRMLRAIRFAAQLDFDIEPLTLAAIKKNAGLIKHISMERIRYELFKMLTTKKPSIAIKLLDQSTLLDYILPELKACQGVEQGGHHQTDVWNHVINSTDHCPTEDPIVKMAALLHDIGKPATYKIIDGKITFYNHEIVGSRMVKRIAKRLKLSNLNKERLFKLVRYHMFFYQEDHSDAAIRRMIRKIGLENINDILALRQGDRLGSGSRKTSWRLEELKDRIREQLNQPLEVTDLKINGHDLMTQLNLKPGPIIGQILDNLLELVLEKPELNTKDELLRVSRRLIKEQS